MDAERWSEIERIYHLAREQMPDQRAAFLHQACGGDEALRREVESLLSNATGAEEYLQAAVQEVASDSPSESFYIGQYRVLEEVGRGGMGVVYCAEDPRIGRRVAIKTIQWAAALDPTAAASLQAQFLQEARSVGNLAHPNIVTFYHVGEHQGQPFIAMEFIDGQPLTRLIRPVLEDLTYQRWLVSGLGQIASALDYAHSKYIVHRDVKPGNILIGKNKIFKIADFGIAKIRRPTDPTTTAFPIGTPSYISPEQLRGQSATSRSDQYCLGVTAFQVLTNKLPFSGDASGSLIHRIVSEPPPAASSFNSDISPAADSVLQRVLSKHPADRFDSCAQFIEALTASLRIWNRRIPPSAPIELPSFISGPPKQTLGEKWLRSRLSLRVTIIVIGLLVLAIFSINHEGLVSGPLPIAEQPTLRPSQVLRAPPSSQSMPPSPRRENTGGSGSAETHSKAKEKAEPTGDPEASEELYYALKEKKPMPVIEALLDRGPLIDGKWPYRVPLVGAAEGCEPEIALELLAKGADPNAPITNGLAAKYLDTSSPTALMVAAERECLEVARILLDHGAKPNLTSSHPALAEAVTRKSEPIVLLLLEHGADPNLESPLIEAAGGCNKAIVSLLLDWKAQVDITNFDGKTPLMAAAMRGCQAVVLTLLAKGARVNQADHQGRTALYYVIKERQFVYDRHNFAIVSDLIKAGADVSLASRTDRITPLMLASTKRVPALVQLLLQNGADPKAVDSQGRTALLHALVQGNAETIELLLAHGVPVNTRDKSGMTALDHAMEKNFLNSENAPHLSDILRNAGGVE